MMNLIQELENIWVAAAFAEHGIHDILSVRPVLTASMAEVACRAESRHC